MGKETFYKKGYEMSVDNWPPVYPLPQSQVDELKNISVTLEEKGFSNSADVPTRALVDADRHVQADILSMPPINVTIEEKGFSNSANVPTRALVDADRHVQVKVNNYPTEYPLPASQVSDLKNIRQLTSSDMITIANQIAKDADGHAQVDVLTLPSLPSGSNTIGNVNAIKSGTWNIDNLYNPHPISVIREGTVKHFSVAASGAGSTVIHTPASGKAVQILGWSFICDADVTCLLRFTTSGNVIAGIPMKGAHAANLLGLTPPQGAANETVEIYVSGAANVKGWICVKEV